MKIEISEDAMKWFHEEMEVEPEETVRFFARYGGSSKIQPGFSLGVTKEEPYEAAVETTEEDVTFFIEESDIWYFDGHDLHVSVDDHLQELMYSYEKE